MEIVTCNDKHLTRPEKLTALIACELQRHSVGIAALQETRLPDESQLTEAGRCFTFFSKGNLASERMTCGVNFAIRTDLVRKLDRLSAVVIELTHDSTAEFAQ